MISFPKEQVGTSGDDEAAEDEKNELRKGAEGVGDYHVPSDGGE